MKIAVLLVVGAALVSLRMWAANRRREQFERATRFRSLPLPHRPAPVMFLLVATIVILVVVAFLSFNRAMS